jgi:hypothetical protein
MYFQRSAEYHQYLLLKDDFFMVFSRMLKVRFSVQKKKSRHAVIFYFFCLGRCMQRLSN